MVCFCLVHFYSDIPMHQPYDMIPSQHTATSSHTVVSHTQEQIRAQVLSIKHNNNHHENRGTVNYTLHLVEWMPHMSICMRAMVRCHLQSDKLWSYGPTGTLKRPAQRSFVCNKL